MRRYDDPVDPTRRYRERPGVYAVIREGRDVLVTEQVAPRVEFQLPGGGIDPGEGALQALHRECLEETGWRIAIERRLGAWQRFTYMPDYDLWAHKICHVYLARPVRRLGPPTEPGHSAVWMPIATAVADLAMDGDRAFLASVSGKRVSGARGRP